MSVIPGWTVVALALAYVGALFLLAWIGDYYGSRGRKAAARPFIYATSLAVYCTSWTFFGSVGLAASSGYGFVPVYLGAIIAFVFGWPLILHIIRVAKKQNITSVADFLSARYGRSPTVAAVVTLIAVIGTLPYIALQLKAVLLSVDIILGPGTTANLGLPVDTALVVALVLALFAVLFGTRYNDGTEHQDGMMLAVAAESVIKLVAFLAVGAFVTLQVFGGVGGLVDSIKETARLNTLFVGGINGPLWVTITLLSFCAILLLPRQFHVTVIENKSAREVKTAAWLFPLYLVLINLFVLPIAAAGLLVLRPDTPPDSFVLALPQALGSPTMTLVAFLGGLSAATAMVIVDSVALAIMISNGIVLPLLLYRRKGVSPRSSGAQSDMTDRLLIIRRAAICVVILLGYGFFKLLGTVQGLASIGLVSFAAIAQLAPAFFGGLLWRFGTAQGATAGMLAGFAVWGYTLVLPWFVQAGMIAPEILTQGPFGIQLLAPQKLLGIALDPLSHGVLWSLSANTLTFLFVSLQRYPSVAELQLANAFAYRPRAAATARRQATSAPADLPRRTPETTLTAGDLQAMVARYVGVDRTARAMSEFQVRRGFVLEAAHKVDPPLLQYAETLLTSAIGPASSRIVMTVLLRRDKVSDEEAWRLLDDVSEALQFNYGLLQSALNQVLHGLAVFDKEMRLIAWNKQFRELLQLPENLGRVGVPLAQLLATFATRKAVATAGVDAFVQDRLARFVAANEVFYEHIDGGRRILEIRSVAMPQGGIVTTFADVTERELASRALAEAAARADARVHERTLDLVNSNRELLAAKAVAEQASLDKTRFLAAASHDVLQPLSAARLYATTLMEKHSGSDDAQTARSIDQSLEAVEEILNALIEIARIDTGRVGAVITAFPLNELFEQLKVEFAPLAKERGLKLRMQPTTLWVSSDRRLARRVLQNLVANALKYTVTGGVVVGVRRKRGTTLGDLGRVVFQVSDSGPGIPFAKQTLIFQEFQRLEETAGDVRGLGLGLSIVDRVTKMLAHPVGIASRLGHGSTFTVDFPRAALSLENAASERQAPAVPITRLTGISVLVIDNEPNILEGMRGMLLGWGCDVHTASSMKHALEILYSGVVQPDLILADYHLDLGNGLDAVQAIRIRLGASVPAVIITADSSPEVYAQARRDGFPVMRKPVRTASLRALITQLTLQRASAAE